MPAFALLVSNSLIWLADEQEFESRLRAQKNSIPNMSLPSMRSARPLIIGGKSMGGSVASMVADELFASGKIRGPLCVSYPFHPPAKLEQRRTKHLVNLKTQ